MMSRSSRGRRRRGESDWLWQRILVSSVVDRELGNEEDGTRYSMWLVDDSSSVDLYSSLREGLTKSMESLLLLLLPFFFFFESLSCMELAASICWVFSISHISVCLL